MVMNPVCTSTDSNAGVVATNHEPAEYALPMIGSRAPTFECDAYDCVLRLSSNPLGQYGKGAACKLVARYKKHAYPPAAFRTMPSSRKQVYEKSDFPLHDSRHHTLARGTSVDSHSKLDRTRQSLTECGKA
jgi:hypothetical protein